METFQTKICPLCTGPLPISRFGLCRARKDGRNLYCKSCIRQKVSDARKALKEYKAVRRTYAEQQAKLEAQFGTENLWTESSMWKLTPVERVKAAIARGAHTQGRIRFETKLSADEIGDALANLLLWTKEIRTQVVGNTRLYFLNESAETATVDETPKRKECVKSSAPLMEYVGSLGPLVKGEKSIRRVA